MIFRSRELLIFLLLAVGTVQAEVLTVGPGGAYQTISSAIAAAADGDTIRVESGSYNEELTVDKRLRLEGINMPIIIGTRKGSTVTMIAPGSVISGFRIEGCGGDLQKEDAGILLRSDGNIVENNELEDVLFGIYLYHSSNNTIRGNRVVGRKHLESGGRGAGLHLWNSSGNTLEENIISHTRDGMYIQSSPDNTIRGNRVSQLRYGLHFMNSDDNRFEDNVFHDNIAGAAIMYSQRIELRRNTFVRNRGFSSFGILFQDCRNCVTEENLILDNAVGLFLEATNDSVFRRNTVAENDVAMQIFSSSKRTVFTMNNFINNLSPLQIVGNISSSTKWDPDEGGNYWSDYDGYDMDGDGIGDVRHRIHNIFEYLEGNHPRLRIYLNSPAARSIVVTEKSFPILKGSNEFDNRPLMRPVKIATTFLPERSSGRAGWFLLAFSSMMLGVAVAVFYRGLVR
ncbi:MAG: nitrous oxide reductase family maturation protein NosD [Acidobacteria bacterium]|nr:nitrous oxide reductase family maturation protein NosD [Acidobacteriota bacterium]